MTVITVKELATQARRLAQREPERKASCSYVRYVDGEALANRIVGQAAFNLGISLDVLAQKNVCRVGGLAGDAVSYDKAEWLDASAEDAELYMRWLGDLQAHQDDGHTWGEALAFADRALAMRQFEI